MRMIAEIVEDLGGAILSVGGVILIGVFIYMNAFDAVHWSLLMGTFKEVLRVGLAVWDQYFMVRMAGFAALLGVFVKFVGVALKIMHWVTVRLAGTGGK
jgi:hypothetical protein